MNRKFKWHDDHGRSLTAGGLLPFDDKGVWLIGETKKGEDKLEWTDIGGKYAYEDCDIYKTIARELGEELYHSSELLRRDVFDFSKRYEPVYINGHRGLPVYVCYPIPLFELVAKGCIFNIKLFHENRLQAMRSNPQVPDYCYPVVEFRYFTFDNLPKKLSFRLRRILKNFSFGKMKLIYAKSEELPGDQKKC